MPPIVKTVYLLRRKSCAQFGLNFSTILLCQVEILDGKNTTYFYLLGKKISINLWFTFISHCRPEILQLEFIAYTCCHFGCSGNSVLYYCGIGLSIVTSGRKNQNRFLIFFSIHSSIFRIEKDIS